MENILQVERIFQYDYIYFDLIFLIIWIFILLKAREYKSLLIGITISPVIYLIDAYIWWNNQTADTNIYIREYYIDGIKIANDITQTTLEKFGADFMMTISYSLFNFTFIFLAFKYINNFKKIFYYSSIWLTFWIIVPTLSFLSDVDNRLVHSIRHMEGQYYIWVGSTIIGYILVYVFSKYNYKLVLQLFTIGCIAGFIMELPLYIFGIRPGLNLDILVFDTVSMINQAVPILYFSYIMYKKYIIKIS